MCNTPWCLLPQGTKLIGPVVILKAKSPHQRATVTVSHKLVFPDATAVVVGAFTRLLWAGSDGTAFDVDPKVTWQPVAATRPSGVITL